MTQATIDYSKVYFIGAGPGDCELITLKGYRILAEADVVIYAGSLINHDLLKYCKEGAACHDSAKLNLEEIISLMQQGIEQGKLVVRLQTGDLSLYGSIREQSEELAKLNIGFVSVPGVSSFLGAASQLGVEYTVPEVAQSLIITRMEGRTPMPFKESLEAFAQHQTSMAIFLSVQNIASVVDNLHDEGKGYPMDTPVAVIYKATWPDEQKVEGTLADIAQKVKEAGINKTALILVGRFLGEEYHYSKLYDADFSHEFRKA
ncbi:cobalt-precorrin-4 methyltransferase [Entomomonas sp. E2T0]|uniref:cobalt-precorrin-4 methyltransferase n=1 Tax=Entomomonas sp. E2T0 TaxID=2930213 RepID=UPI002228516F|nr:cobalt-precorrin-4 methyltransferase [Entomomonas sp. E2T0]UYZ82673.1 cobalt-precorrin-4 methyltransferase [Entomomonas sp. E2T0]